MLELRGQNEPKLSWFQLRVEEICETRNILSPNSFTENQNDSSNGLNFPKIVSKEILV